MGGCALIVIMIALPRFSFRQLLLLAFLLIAGLLTTASVSGLFTLERLLTQSRSAAERAVQQTAAAQQLAERSIAMERAARQYLVLDDPVLLTRFQEAARDARQVLDHLVAQRLPQGLADTWLADLDAVSRLLQGPASTQRQRGEALATQFQALDQVNAAIADEVRQASEARSRLLQAELEAGRTRLGRQVLAAIVLAIAMALGFALWLGRPLQQLGRAIVRLGENRFDAPVNVQGPSDLRALGKQLDWLRLRLKELDDDKSRFLRHVSHELKTPLTALREGVALLEDGVAGELTADQAEIARILRQNAMVLQAQIEDLLRFNAAAFDARRLSRRPTELGGLIRALIDAQSLQWQSRQLRMELQGGPLTAEVDPDKLGVAIGNLLSNAIRYSPEGGCIQIVLSQVDRMACIDVIDQGPGVPQTDVAHIFDPFYRGELQPEGAVRGTGIGLSIVREYLEAHGGRIELRTAASSPRAPADRPHPGAHFRIELPHVLA